MKVGLGLVEAWLVFGRPEGEGFLLMGMTGTQRMRGEEKVFSCYHRGGVRRTAEGVDRQSLAHLCRTGDQEAVL